MKKFLPLLLCMISIASAQTYYEKTTIPPKIAAGTIICNNTTAIAAPIQCTGAQFNVMLGDPLNVINCGAVMDNRDNITAYNTCRALTVAGGGSSGSIIGVPNGSENNSANPTGSGSGGVLWRYNGTVTNNNASSPVIGKNVDEVENFSLITGKYFGRAASASGMGPIMRLDNNVTHSGDSGQRNTLQVNTTIKPNASPLAGSEWGILSQMDYQATNSTGQHTPLVGYLNKYGSSLTGLFGANVEFNDRTTQITSVSGPGNTMELDYQANNVDDGGALNGLVPIGQGIRIGELIALIDSAGSAPGWLGQTVTGGGEFVGTGSQTGTVLTINAVTNATCTGSTGTGVNATTLTCTGAAGSNFFVGEALTGTNVPANTTITKALTGTGGNGTYLLSTQPSPAISGTTVTGTPTIHNGDMVYQPNEPPCQNPTNCEFITSFGTGSGGAGTYNMSASVTVAANTVLNATIPPTFGWGSKVASQLGNYYFTLNRGYAVINATIGKAAFSCEYVLFATNADCVRMVGGGAIGFDIGGADGIAAHRLLYENSKLSYDVNGSTVFSVGDAGAGTFSGLLTASLGATISGAAISGNASSNFNTSFNTGTSTGTFTAGQNSATPSAIVLAGPVSFQAGTAYSGASWGTTSPVWNGVAMTLNDTTASGTVTQDAAYTFQAPNYTSTGGAATTITSATTMSISPPTCSGGVVCTNLYALNIAGRVNVTSGTLNIAAGGNFSGGALNFNNNSNNTVGLCTGTCNSTVTLGGASTTLITSPAPFTMSNATVKMTGITTGTNADTVCLSATGVVLIQAAACTISSLRFKKDVKDVHKSTMPQIARLSVASFRMKDGEKNRDPNGAGVQVGLIAENIASVAPECAVYENDMKTPKSYRQECVIALMVKAMQEQQGEIRALRSALERRNAP